MANENFGRKRDDQISMGKCGRCIKEPDIPKFVATILLNLSISRQHFLLKVPTRSILL
jgi:hypothetical protein